jgi:hypothetical protein
LRATLNFLLAFLTVVPAIARAQQDTTPPVLLDFTISPTVIDTGLSDVTLNWCATARDNLSGLKAVCDGFGNCSNFESGTLEGTTCGQHVIPRFSPYQTYKLCIEVLDDALNVGGATHPGRSCAAAASANLCLIGPCEVINSPGGTPTDGDGDGVADSSDNCPNDPNPGQEDVDLDLIGDVCDPFPNDRDNEQAQCEADLAVCDAGAGTCPADLVTCETELGECTNDLGGAAADLVQCSADLGATQATRDAALADLTSCQGGLGQCTSDLAEATGDLGQCSSDLGAVQAALDAATADQDGDGVRDPDQCPGSASGPVDLAGCTVDQFCGSIDATTVIGKATCKRSDWKNDEPLMRSSARDCDLDRNGSGAADDRCVPAP